MYPFDLMSSCDVWEDELLKLNPIIPVSSQNSTVMMSPDSQTQISSSAPSPYPDNTQVSQCFVKLINHCNVWNCSA
ncbi:hypothetical protein LSH36_52g04027 [Paralvinella palmiformis]|uniref:Uncharacterized protein n=1 Tax=Paralvinella palmiformis TaxID=53620 RepID=A0AAD9NE59_9ANNE|nr:hypothetical protein LSH36_52g04027 [Paralvinella palmiformis]